MAAQFRLLSNAPIWQSKSEFSVIRNVIGHFYHKIIITTIIIYNVTASPLYNRVYVQSAPPMD